MLKMRLNTEGGPASDSGLRSGKIAACSIAPHLGEATSRPGNWERILRDIAATLGVEFARIVQLEPSQAPGGELPELPLFCTRDFVQHWRMTHGQKRASIAELYTIGEWIDYAEIDQRRPDAIIGPSFGIAFRTHDSFWCLLLEIRPKSASIITIASVLEPCIRELEDAMLVMRTAEYTRVQTILDILDSSGTVAIALGAEGQIVMENISAKKEFSFLPQLRANLVENALPKRDARSGAHPADTLASSDSINEIQVGSDGHRFLVYSAGSATNTRHPFAASLMIKVAFDIGSAAEINSNPDNAEGRKLQVALHQTFGLTRSESALALSLMSMNLRVAAATNKMAHETARSHLKSIFRKTGLRRQGVLMTLLARIAYHTRLRDTLMP